MNLLFKSRGHAFLMLDDCNLVDTQETVANILIRVL